MPLQVFSFDVLPLLLTATTVHATSPGVHRLFCGFICNITAKGNSSRHVQLLEDGFLARLFVAMARFPDDAGTAVAFPLDTSSGGGGGRRRVVLRIWCLFASVARGLLCQWCFPLSSLRFEARFVFWESAGSSWSTSRPPASPLQASNWRPLAR